MKEKPKMNFIYSDLMKLKSENVIILSTIGTKQDLERYNINFEEGKPYWFWVDNEEENPLLFSGVVSFDNEENEWTALIDRLTIKPLSESKFNGMYTSKDIQGLK